jgi:tetratricopeptide (TPR) repeat protein/DNA-binding XRE family transcriptional regulator
VSVGTLAALLRDWRQEVGLTQEELASRSGLSVRAISDLERGRSNRPHRQSVRLIADALALSGKAREEFFEAAGCSAHVWPHDRPLRAAAGGLTTGGLTTGEVTTGGLTTGGLTTGELTTGGLAAADEQGPRPRAEPARTVVPRQLPGALRNFAGRAAELKALTAMLDQPDAVAGAMIVAIAGTAGVGKTALAVHWVHQIAGRYPDGQLYINLRGFDSSAQPVPAEEALRAFLDALQGSQSQIPGSVEAQIGLYRSLLAGRRCLIVLDNAYDTGQVRPLLPGSSGCLVVVTSRSELTSLVAAEGAQLMTLGVLTEQDAQEMVARRLDAERVAGEPQAVLEMINLCARLPLAVSVAVARAAGRPGFPLAALVEELQDAGGRLDALESEEAATSVRAVFSWSQANLSEPSARMFRLLSEHPGPDISPAAAASLAGVPREQARGAVRELARSHLLSEQAPGRFAVHDLLRAFAGEQARARDGDSERAAAARRLLDHYLHTCDAIARQMDPTRAPMTLDAPQPGVLVEDPGNYQQSWSWLEAEYRVLLAATDLAATARVGKHAWQIPWAMQTYFFRRGHWHDFAAVQRTAVDVALRLADVLGQAQAYHALGRACALIGSFQEAQDHLSLALELYRQLGDQPAEARWHIDMGYALARQGRYTAALHQAQQARELYRAVGHLAGQAGALNNIGWYQMHLGHNELALANCQKSLRMFEKAGSGYGVAVALSSVGYAYHRLGDHTRAIAYCEQGRDGMHEYGDRTNEADNLMRLGEIHSEVGNRQAAREAWQRALAVLSDLRHPDAALLRSKLYADRALSGDRLGYRIAPGPA